VITHVVSMDEAGAALRQWSEHPSGVTKIHVALEA
jgi:hypothetical protein